MTTAQGGTAAVERVAIIGPSDLSIVRNRDSLVRALIARRRIVLCIAPAFEPERRRLLNLLGAETIPFDPPAGRVALIDAWRNERALAGVLADWRADAVLGFGPRTMIDAALAARRAGIGRVVSLITAPLEDRGTDGEPATARQLARALDASTAVVAHNSQLLRQARAVTGAGEDRTWTVVPGAGVDLEHHHASALPPIDEGLIFLMIARLEERRGINEYVDAARQIRAHGRRARFQLVATPGTSADAIPRDALAAYAGDVEILDPVDDVRPLFAKSHVYVYPSRGEGLPRSVLEALAAGRPVITSDTPGCREAVDERVNGYLVPPRDAGALTLAIESLLKRPDLIPSQARASRLKAERRFDVREVDRALLDSLGIR